MGCCDQSPLAIHRGAASSVKPSEFTVEHGLAEHRLDCHLTFSVQPVAVSRPRAGSASRCTVRRPTPAGAVLRLPASGGISSGIPRAASRSISSLCQ